MDIKRMFKPAKKEIPIHVHIEVVFKPIMPEGAANDAPHQDRIREKLSMPSAISHVPKPNPALGNYRGHRVRLLLRDGVVLKGTPQRTEWDFLRLANIEETGDGYELTADWISIKSDTIARIYPANAKIQKTEDK